MLKNKLLLIFIIFIVSGCTVEYNLNVSSKNEEHITILVGSEKIEDDKNFKIPALFSQSSITYDTVNNNNIEYYKVNYLQNNKFRFNFVYDKYELSDSNAANTCYEYFDVSKEGNNVSILTSNSFNCFASYKELEKVTINITSYYDVVQSNADQISGKKHTWIITPENASNKPIIFVYDETKKNITFIDYITNNAYIAVLLGIFIFIVLPILLFMKLKSKRANKI